MLVVGILYFKFVNVRKKIYFIFVWYYYWLLVMMYVVDKYSKFLSDKEMKFVFRMNEKG